MATPISPDSVLQTGRRRLTVAVLAAVATSACPALAAGPLRLRVASAYTEDTFQVQNLKFFLQRLSRAQPDLAVSLHAADGLVRPEQVFSAVRSGSVEAGEFLLSSQSAVASIFGLDALPFVARDYKTAKFLWRAAQEEVRAQLAKQGLHLMYAVPWPPQHLYSHAPVGQLSDMRGQRFRTFNPATLALATAGGATPTQIELNQVERALAEGRFDIMLTSSVSGVGTKAWSRMRYLYLIGAFMPKNVVVVNAAYYASLPPSLRDAMTTLAREAEQRGWEASAQLEQESLRTLARNRIAIDTPSPLLETQLRFFGERAAARWAEEAGPSGLDVLFRYETARSAGEA
jgi:TRAP-type C4-dicarboxylate transport system substrate-binding protein